MLRWQMSILRLPSHDGGQTGQTCAVVESNIARSKNRNDACLSKRSRISPLAPAKIGSPFGVSYYSADVFARRDEFVLDWCGGAPPEPYFKDDEFTQKWGQNWGIPLYDWKAMRGNNFEWWRQRVRAVKSTFHLFRIDHVLGFY